MRPIGVALCIFAGLQEIGNRSDIRKGQLPKEIGHDGLGAR
jgi:hypothetical protein